MDIYNINRIIYVIKFSVKQQCFVSRHLDITVTRVGLLLDKLW